MLEMVIETRLHNIGAFEVGRVLPFRKRRMVGPFIFFDRMGPQHFAAPITTDADVLPHPHTGLATVTYLFEGTMTHRDSLGVQQQIRPGELNWMSAGSGISHSERFDDMRPTGGTLDGIQAWVALPKEFEESDPSFQHFDTAQLPLLEDTHYSGRLIAGKAFGCEAPVDVFSPLFYVDLQVKAGGRIPLPSAYSERAIYVAKGVIEYGGHRYEAGHMLVFAVGADPDVRAVGDARVMLLGGESVGERFMWWNFVASSKERLEQAKADWQSGRIALPPMDNEAYIPLPEQ